MRYICPIMAALFVLCTYWQFNDLSQYNTELWYAWVIAYALCVIVSLICWWTKFPRWILWLGSAVAAGVAVVRSLDIEWQKTVLFNDGNPSGNETGGLLIIAGWLGFLAWKQSSLRCKCNKS